TGKAGMPLLRILVKTTVNTARYSSGLASDQTNPRAEFLYLTLRSLRTSSASSSYRTRDWAAARASAALRSCTMSLPAPVSGHLPVKLSGVAASARATAAELPLVAVGVPGVH